MLDSSPVLPTAFERPFAASVSSVQLFVPDLAAAGAAIPGSLSRHRGLSRLLSRGRKSSTSADDFCALLCRAFGVERQRDWPVAPLTLLADGTDAGPHFWLRADPVHLHARQAELILVDSSRFPLSPEEADELVAALNRHFAAEGLEFLAPNPRRWYAKTAVVADIHTTSPLQATGHSIDALLPRGPHALRWHGLLNEAQMVLHDHPTNERREAAGEPTINSLWLWGGGRLPHCPKPGDLTVWTDDPLGRGLALCAGIDARPLPPGAEALVTHSTEHWVVVDPLADADPNAYLTALEDAWFAPLLARLSRGALTALTVHTHIAGRALRFDVSVQDLWKWWRRDPGLAPAASEGSHA